MCGILGFISPAPVSTSRVIESLGTIAHRGPDGTGVAVFNDPRQPPRVFGTVNGDGGVGLSDTWRPLPPQLTGDAAIVLGHQRLAIVELSAMGHQPMASHDGRHWIVFNGEIYNHVELREELKAQGHVFRSQSDTELILVAYRAWGVDCLHRFNGMWSFCLIDQSAGTMFLARDRFGVKPMYLWKDGGALHFASEIKAFLPQANFTVRADIARVKSYLAEGPSDWRETTMYDGVAQLGAGCMIHASLSDSIDPLQAQRRWWTLETNTSKESLDDRLAARYAEEYRDLLDQSVRIRLRADVEVGSALSGGLDSSSVVYLASKALEELPSAPRQHSFSSVYSRPGTEACDESAYIREIAALCGVTMNTIEPDPQDVPEQHARVIWHMDTPPESTCMSGWHTFKLVQRTGIKVTLDGQGADEQLGGYLFYLPHRLWGVGVAEAVREFRGMANVQPRRYAYGAAGMTLLQHGGLSRRLLRGHRRDIGDKLAIGMNRHLVEDSRTDLANLIRYADRTSMAFGVESRMPFLDVRLATFLASLPEAYKVHRGWTKYIARKAFDHALPDSVTWRKDKMGWPIPERVWADGTLKGWFDRPRTQVGRFDEWGVGPEFRACLDSGSMTERVRALNLSAWAETFCDGGWRNMT